ncbi:MAG: hypothetical protein AAF747_01425 [Planctomycetota bacterium]
MPSIETVRGRLIDDRGRQHDAKPIDAFVGRSLPSRDGDQPSRDAVRFVRAWRTVLKWEPFAASAIPLGLGFGAMTAVITRDEWRTAGREITLLVTVIVVGTLLSGWLIRRHCLRLRRSLSSLPTTCLVCVYDLRSIELDDDGCKVCPECGAAWKFYD